MSPAGAACGSTRTAPWRGKCGARIQLAGALVLALGLAGLLKLHLQRARFEELRWLLAPTARAVQLVTGSPFELEPQRGYLCRARRFEIVPACAGVNFMIIAFLSLVLGNLTTRRSVTGHGLLLLASLTAAYGVTIAANATRIAVAMRMHEVALAMGPLTPERLHRVEGVAVYFFFLCVLVLVAPRLAEVCRAPAR